METLRILWLNWRDIRHPLAGGAEVYTHEIARRLTAKGHEIILVTSRPPGLPEKEEIEGYTIIRRGGRLTVYLAARKTYHELREQGWKPDIIIDEVNTIPFMTPLYAKEPIVMLIHQLCRDCWRHAIHPLAQPPGWLLERILHRTYIKATRNRKVRTVITVSESSKQDLMELGYPEGTISIVPNGLDWSFYSDCIKLANRKEPLVTYVGRITPYKRLEDLVKAWGIVEREQGDTKLVIAGRPDVKYLEKLKRLTEKLGLEHVEYRTNIPRQEKKTLLAKAMMLVYTSIREGWGQTITEAAACKTPAIAYNVPGLRDSVKHMETGILVKPGDIRGLAEAIITLIVNRELRERLAENAYRRAQQYNWDRSAREFLEVILGALLIKG